MLNELPPSLPEWQSSGETFGPLGIDILSMPRAEALDYINLGYYVVEKEPEGFGRIIGVEGGTNLGAGIAGSGQYVYVELEAGTARVGTSLTAVKSLGRLKKVNKAVKGSLEVYNIEVQGRLELVKALDSQNEGKDLFKALVHHSINSVMVGSVLVEQPIDKISLDIDGPRSAVVSEIIGGGFDENRMVLGSGSIIFLNKGSEDGLRKNQVLSVNETILIRNRESKLKGSIRQIAWVQIANTQANFSTAIVLKSLDAMTPGDVTSGEKLISASDGGGDDEFIDDEGVWTKG